MTYDIRTVLVSTTDGDSFLADVMIGDGQTDFDDEYEFDEMIYFYFHDLAEFEEAKQAPTKYVPFTITEEGTD